MKRNYDNFKFEEFDLIMGDEYVGEIIRWRIKEDDINGDKLQIWVKLYVEKETSFMFSCRISQKRNSRFYSFCRKMELLAEDNSVDFSVLDSECDVVCILSETKDNAILVSSMEWLVEEEEDEEVEDE